MPHYDLSMGYLNARQVFRGVQLPQRSPHRLGRLPSGPHDAAAKHRPRREVSDPRARQERAAGKRSGLTPQPRSEKTLGLRDQTSEKVSPATSQPCSMTCAARSTSATCPRRARCAMPIRARAGSPAEPMGPPGGLQGGLRLPVGAARPRLSWDSLTGAGEPG